MLPRNSAQGNGLGRGDLYYLSPSALQFVPLETGQQRRLMAGCCMLLSRSGCIKRSTVDVVESAGLACSGIKHQACCTKNRPGIAQSDVVHS